jgi:hypothetical protein
VARRFPWFSRFGGGFAELRFDHPGARRSLAPDGFATDQQQGVIRAFSSRVESPGGSGNAPNQTNRAVDLMQSDRKPL